MSRTAPPPTVTPAMYRHFAVATLAVTACIGLLVNGERADGGIAAQVQNDQTLRTGYDDTGKHKLAMSGMAFHDARKIKGAWGLDPDISPDDDASDGDGSSYSPGADAYGASRPIYAGHGGPGPAGYAATLDLPQGMSREQAQKLIPQPSTRTAGRGPTPGELQQIREASRERSGAPDSDE